MPADTAVLSGRIISPAIKPQTGGTLQIALPKGWKQYDILYITAKDLFGKEIYTWSWPITLPDKFSGKMVSHGSGTVTVQEENYYFLILSSKSKNVSHGKSELISAITLEKI